MASFVYASISSSLTPPCLRARVARFKTLEALRSSSRHVVAGISHIGSLQAQRAVQTRCQHHSQVLQGHSFAGLSNKRCVCSRRAPFLSVFIYQTVDGQRKCPAKWPAKMSLVLLAMITDGSYPTRSRFMGGLTASMYPVFPILGVFRLKGQPKRDGSIIVRSCKASQSPVYPIRDAFLAVNHASCPSFSSSVPRQWGESALKTSRLPGALSPSWQDRGCTLPQLGAGDNRPIRSNTPWNNRRGTDISDN